MTAEPTAVDPPEPADQPSKWGGPGLTWAGDGALSAGRARARSRSALDVDFEIYPPALEEGDDGYPLASFNRRWVGFIVDQVVILGCAFLVALLTGTLDSAGAETTAAWAVTLTLVRVGFGLIFNPRGWSPGKQVVGLRIVTDDGEPPGLRWGVMRTAGAVFSEMLYIGYIWAFFDSKTQTWHDKLAKTYVVRVEGVEPKVSGGWNRR